MAFEELLRQRRIHTHRATDEEVTRLLALADRDIKMARKTMPEDWDWAFSIAYNAVPQAARAFMYSQGFRPASEQGHKNTFAFMREALGEEFASLVGYFDRMRTKRNQAIYDVAGLITETEAKAIFKKAVEFVELIRARVARSSA
ncbi:MAG: HEPN domain-containing protein [Thermoanaerobaculales bacterium]